MKKRIFAGAVLALGVTNVLADCTVSTETSASVLVGTSISATGGEVWNESHCPSGELWKVGDGANLAVDPPAQVGSYSTSGNTVTYNYGSAATTYTWTLHKVGSTYFFCDGTSEVASGTLGSIGDCSTSSAPLL